MIYEQDFRGFSYGFRPGRSPHQALDALAVGIGTRKVNRVLDADIRKFYDTLDHGWLVKFVEQRIADRRVVRLIPREPSRIHRRASAVPAALHHRERKTIKRSAGRIGSEHAAYQLIIGNDIGG